MPFEISLTSAMRSNLISLQNTASLMARTQGRLATGKAVNAAVDDPAKYFAAASHIDHATDLSARKSDMGEAVQSVQAANNGITGIQSLLSQAKALAQSAQSASQTDRTTLAGQFNTLRTQIDQLAADSGYAGKNFLKSDSLTVLFNEAGTSSLSVQGFDGTASGLGLTTAASGLLSAVAQSAEAVGTNKATGSSYTLQHTGVATGVVVTQAITITGETAIATGTNITAGASYTLLQSGNLTYTGITISAAGSAGSVVLSAGDFTVSYSGSDAVITFNSNITTTGTTVVGYTKNNQLTASTYYTATTGTSNTAAVISFLSAGTASGTVTVTYNLATSALWGTSDAITSDLNNLQSAVTTLRTQASTMAANLGVITNRQTFSASMINTLQTGSDNLTLADMNEEGANLLALQTRQQLGIQALSMASQANQSIMRLFG